MKLIFNNVLPPKGFMAINLFGVFFIRNEYKDYFNIDTHASKVIINHESIHTAQMKEMLYVGFYVAYFFEWLIKLIIYGKSAYYHISFEREAFKYEGALSYLSGRKPFAQYRKATFK